MKKIFLMTFFLPAISYSLNLKLRAREHFENHTIRLSDGVKTKFSGLSNTINLWHEVPYKYSFGLSFSPIVGSLSAKDKTSEAAFGQKVNFKAYGFEGKYFPLKKPIYIRHGLYTSEFDRLSGWGLLTTLGYEYPFKNFGLAFESGQRIYFLGSDKGQAFNLAIGFHFYKM